MVVASADGWVPEAAVVERLSSLPCIVIAPDGAAGPHPLADTVAQYERLRQACTAIGRDPASLRLSAALVTCCGTNDAEVARRAESIGRDLEDLRAHAAAGSPEQVVERLISFAEAGTDTVYLQLRDINDLDQIRLLAEEVLPHLI